MSRTNEVPAGSYRFTAEPRTAGGGEHARIRITGGEHDNHVLDLHHATDGWEEGTPRELLLTSGGGTISIEAGRSGGGQSFAVDSPALVRPEPHPES
ncbi:hypothetical protein ACL03H_01195 [Saccharopolyspora sp. MS10]|uniref:hypothetical protein n=1 Tax=Saccharopolyspora sp. MS10 TaxID=3385973 RepID=UPI0039A2025E